MRIYKYLIGIWTAVAVYTFFSFFSGPKGMSAYNELLSERDMQWSNIEGLRNINEELEKVKNNLLYDYDTLLVHARQLNYGQEGERYVRIVGLENIKNTTTVTGEVYITSEPEFLKDRNIKIVSLCAGLLVFAFLFSLELIESKYR
jgi:cell division protein FtsB